MKEATESRRARQGVTTMQITQEVAAVVRRLAAFEDRKLSDMIDVLTRFYVEQRWPEAAEALLRKSEGNDK